ncbi:tumor necrosis factor receptor superfamily member 10A [Gracilinanus agilis]|uniref:tumor necrosis factor receptor superfamily member 10A n=1 Tax=Gracilinanus agilis TaxID=191870 RepID=UPI001CFE5BA6|nr:tumor necrosis factor receptor superfamily member 10A [Gracilinanus agilis]
MAKTSKIIKLNVSNAVEKQALMTLLESGAKAALPNASEERTTRLNTSGAQATSRNQVTMGHRLLCLDGIERNRAGHHLEQRNLGIETSFQRREVHLALRLVSCAGLSRLSPCLILIVLLGASQASAGTQQRLEKRQTLCPPGQFLNITRTSDRTREICTPCPTGTFTEFSNGLSSCIQCKICKTDQEEINPCHATHNTECQCRPGTFCPKEQPCEICRKCTSECPKGMVKKNYCSPSNDLECQEPTGTRDAEIWLPVVVVVVVLLILFVTGVLFYCCKWRNGSQGCRNSFSIKSLVSHLQRGNHPGQPEARDDEGVEMQTMGKNRPGNQEGEGQGLLEVKIDPQMEQTEAMTLQAKPKALIPANGDPIKTLQESFVYFVREVPWDYWDLYMSQLKLKPNEIMMAKETEKSAIGSRCKMLMTWQQNIGKAATVNILLKTLSKINLEVARGTIEEELIRERLYVYEKSEAEKSG